MDDMLSESPLKPYMYLTVSKFQLILAVYWEKQGTHLIFLHSLENEARQAEAPHDFAFSSAGRENISVPKPSGNLHFDLRTSGFLFDTHSLAVLSSVWITSQ